MNRISLQIKLLYDSMGKAEKRIADWIFENPKKIISLSIIELAEQCNCGEATIVRFAKRLGLNGFQELKFSLASESGASTVNGNISKTDSAYEMFEKVCDDIYCSLELTKKALNSNNTETAAKAICRASKLVLMGLGNSASVAMDASHKFLRAGINAVCYSDNHMQVIACSHLCKDDVAIAITHSGSSKDIVDALKIAREKGAVTIAITNEGKSPVLRYADVVLSTASAETKHNILGLNSRIAQLSIIDALYYYVVFNHSEKALESIKETERSLLSKKY